MENGGTNKVTNTTLITRVMSFPLRNTIISLVSDALTVYSMWLILSIPRGKTLSEFHACSEEDNNRKFLSMNEPGCSWAAKQKTESLLPQTTLTWQGFDRISHAHKDFKGLSVYIFTWGGYVYLHIYAYILKTPPYIYAYKGLICMYKLLFTHEPTDT